MNTAPPPNRFEDRLLAAILTDFDQLTAPPEPAGRTARHTRPVRNARPRPSGARRGRLVAAGAAAAAVAVAVTGVAVSQLNGTAHQGGSGHSLAGGGTTPGSGAPGTGPAGTGHSATGPGGTKVQTAAYVIHRMRSALAANHAILRTSDHAPDSQTGRPVWDIIWSGQGNPTTRTLDLAPDGHPVTGYLVTILPKRTISIVVSYAGRTWTRTVYPFGSATPAGGPAPRHETPAQGAARLRAEVASGELTLVGPAQVDGQKALELRQSIPAEGVLTIWVSPDTYLPIRTLSVPPGAGASSPQAIRDDYTWLPDTAASRHQLTRTAAIPAGFRQVSPH